MTWTKQLKTLATVLPLAAIVAFPTNGNAQHALSGAVLSSVDVAQARALESRAEALLEHPDGWEEAITLYRQAANLRPAGDEMAANDLLMASKLDYYTGNGLRAIVDLQTAAAQALVCDKPFVAAQAYLDAAWIAVTLGLTDNGEHFLAQATRLATFEEMTPAEKRTIRRRINGD